MNIISSAVQLHPEGRARWGSGCGIINAVPADLWGFPRETPSGCRKIKASYLAENNKDQLVYLFC